jgi:hypothetical protein
MGAQKKQNFFLKFLTIFLVFILFFFFLFVKKKGKIFVFSSIAKKICFCFEIWNVDVWIFLSHSARTRAVKTEKKLDLHLCTLVLVSKSKGERKVCGGTWFGMGEEPHTLCPRMRLFACQTKLHILSQTLFKMISLESKRILRCFADGEKKLFGVFPEK